MRIAICVATCQRPVELRRLLNGLNQLTFEKNTPPQVDVIVVENDDSGQGLKVCEEVGPNFRWNLVGGIEPRRGISYARNRGVSMVPPEADFVAFIDDDEIPAPTWLDELLAAHHTYQAEVVSGFVEPKFSPDTPDWIIKGKFFERPSQSTGAVLNTAATNNAMVKADRLRALNPVFDERFALTGSEDYNMFCRLQVAGNKIVRCNEAIVYEPIPPSRMTIQWLMHSSFRVGNSITLSDLELLSGKTWLVRLVKGTGRVVQGMVFMPFHFLMGRAFFVQDLRKIAFGLGVVTALFGYKYIAYRKIHTISAKKTVPSGSVRQAS
ncbi:MULTISPECIES: glycosyltransferase [unclassified Leptolyngbya]|uniref:glycosyltransferase family 2 protein n=1 Tax=unclassified Leptolyngbya TaxID=2650499 RepID=UPI00168A1B0A|nr:MULTISPECIES: glycosyltransferase [unclassified Leptolyngbya]MBD1910728.1 glycosyltransferase family 2 protein [Leptolyngbya sp. FACHB-8]MBD2158163.1 glycosyltransferase family 2 protein [Leptolyngbya sp. FACHB-16]